MDKKITDDIDASMQDLKNLAKKSQKILQEQTGCYLKTNDPAVIDLCTGELITSKFDKILLNFLGNFKGEIGVLGKTYEAYTSHMARFLPKIHNEIEYTHKKCKSYVIYGIISTVLINIFFLIFISLFVYSKGYDNGYMQKEIDMANEVIEEQEKTINQNNAKIKELTDNNKKLSNAIESHKQRNNRNR